MNSLTKIEIVTAGIGLLLTTLGFLIGACIPLAVVGAVLTAVAFGMMIRGTDDP